jgi:hypothetical protein
MKLFAIVGLAVAIIGLLIYINYKKSQHLDFLKYFSMLYKKDSVKEQFWMIFRQFDKLGIKEDRLDIDENEEELIIILRHFRRWAAERVGTYSVWDKTGKLTPRYYALDEEDYFFWYLQDFLYADEHRNYFSEYEDGKRFWGEYNRPSDFEDVYKKLDNLTRMYVETNTKKFKHMPYSGYRRIWK